MSVFFSNAVIYLPPPLIYLFFKKHIYYETSISVNWSLKINIFEMVNNLTNYLTDGDVVAALFDFSHIIVAYKMSEISWLPCVLD